MFMSLLLIYLDSDKVMYTYMLLVNVNIRYDDESVTDESKLQIWWSFLINVYFIYGDEICRWYIEFMNGNESVADKCKLQVNMYANSDMMTNL